MRFLGVRGDASDAAIVVAANAVAVVRRRLGRSSSSSASSNTQHSTHSTNLQGKRPAASEVCQPTLHHKRRKASSTTSQPATSSSCSSSGNNDNEIDTAASSAKPLTVAEAEQLFASVERGDQDLQQLLLSLLSPGGEQAFISFLRYLIPFKHQQQHGKQQQQQQLLSLHVFEALSANQHFLFCDLLQTLSHPDLITCYNACLAFQSLVEAVGADQVLAAVLAAPQGLLLLLAALNERRLQQASQQGYVMSVGYAAQCVHEPLCSGTVACMVKNARISTLQQFVGQLIAALDWQDECSVAAAMVLVIIAYNAAAGVALLLPYMPLLLAAVQQHQRIGKRILLTLKAVTGSSSSAAARALAGYDGTGASTAANQRSHALIRTGISALMDLLVDGPEHSAALAADVILALVRTAPGQQVFVGQVPDIVMVIEQYGPVSFRSFKAVKMLHHIAAGSINGAATVLPYIGSILALQKTVVVLPDSAAAARGLNEQQHHRTGQLQIMIADQEASLINMVIRQTAADLMSALAQHPGVAAAALAKHPCVSLLLDTVRQLQQQQPDMNRADSSVVSAILTAVRALVVVPDGQLALANAHDLGLLLTIMQQGGQMAGLAFDIYYKLVLAATNAAAAAAEANAATTPARTAEVNQTTQQMTTPAVTEAAAKKMASYAGNAATPQCACIAVQMLGALSPDNTRLIVQAALNPSLTLRVFQSLILLCARIPQVTHLLAAHIPVLHHITQNIIPRLGLADRNRLLLLKAVGVISKGAQTHHKQPQQQQQQHHLLLQQGVHKL